MTKEKKILIQQLGSKDNLIAINAVNTLRKERNEARSRADNVFSSVCAGSLTNLAGENFSGANLKGADFSQATIICAKIKNANLENAVFCSDLNRFTDPHHPNFWRPKCSVTWGVE